MVVKKAVLKRFFYNRTPAYGAVPYFETLLSEAA